MKVILYSPQSGSRLSYIIDFFSGQINVDPITITSDETVYKTADAIKINYSSSHIADEEIWIQPNELLFENNIQLQAIQCFEWNEQKAFFKTRGDIPFDIFSAAFYLLSRYEEYLPHEEDIYGRYTHTDSIAFKENFLHLPLINLWIEEFHEALRQKNSSFTIHHLPFNFLPTYDIDIAYSYRHKHLLIQFGGAGKELISLQWRHLIERVKVLSGISADPFDNYQWLDELHRQYNLHPYYFFLLAEKRKGYDKNISPHVKEMQNLIRQHAAKYGTGIHPSWQSGDDDDVLKKEISLLQNIIEKPVTKSRQHYIRMELPQTYRLLIDNGITEDHSMGYGSINGFRASVASPFYWYDLEREQQTSLLLRPFCFMEANSYFQQDYSAEQAGNELQQYHDIVKSVDGELITIFHNHFITQQKEWLPWRNIYAEFLRNNFG